MAVDYNLKPEEKARHDIINPKLIEAGWVVQQYKSANIYESKGVAIEYFQLGRDVGEADYVLFVDGKACGIIEAKKEGTTLSGKEPQSNNYAKGFPEEYQHVELPLPFVYESTGTETRFTNLWDPKPRSREVFSFHKPETLENWIVDNKNTLRKRLTEIPVLYKNNLWLAQEQAIKNVEESLKNAKPKALIQMATGSGKTFTAVNVCYRLIKFAKAKRILFLVDRDNLGIQTDTEFQTFIVPNDGRKFTELYNVNKLTSNTIFDSDKVCISTIQRIYSMLKGKNIDYLNDDESNFEDNINLEPEPIEYNSKLPPEFFDFIIVDECHRSIYNLWKQVLDYFDAFVVGLTATPSKSTIGFFDKNLVMEYSHEKAVADQVNVDFDVYKILTRITKEGSLISKGETIIKREIRTRRKRWETLDEDIKYDGSKLDKSVVAKDQIRTVIRTFKNKIKTEIFPGRKYVPKTLIFAKDDAHAEEIVQIVREEFNEGNEFAQKITYKTEGETPQNLIKQFRNEFNPRIAVTVDMIATGTDVKPLEVVFFMRDVKSRNYFEQMKGRGVRVIKNDDFKAVTPDAMAKERFVIIDAVGVCENRILNETTQLDRKPLVSFEKLLTAIRYGKPKIDNISSMASRLSRLQKKLTDKQIEEIITITNGKKLSDFSADFVKAIDENIIYLQTQEEYGDSKDYLDYIPKQKELDAIIEKRIIFAIKPFIGNTKLMERLPEIKLETEQIIDDVSIDDLVNAEYSPIAKEKAKTTVSSFKKFIVENKNELTAIQVFYNRGNLNWKDLKIMADKIMSSPYNLTTSKLWQAYHQLDDRKVRGQSRKDQIADFISLLRFELQKTEILEPYQDSVDKRFSYWLSNKIASGVHFNQEQLNWLEKIKQHVSDSIEITQDDFEDTPFVQMGGLGKAFTVFGSSFSNILQELNIALGVQSNVYTTK